MNKIQQNNENSLSEIVKREDNLPLMQGKSIDENKNEYGVLILSDRDRIEFDYILKIRGSDWVHYAIKNLIGNRKPYVSNIAKIAQIEIPKNLSDPEKIISIDQGLEMISKVIRIRKK